MGARGVTAAAAAAVAAAPAPAARLGALAAPLLLRSATPRSLYALSAWDVLRGGNV